MPKSTEESSWPALAMKTSILGQASAYLLERVSNSQNWRRTSSARKVSTPLWTSIRQPADNILDSSKQTTLLDLASHEQEISTPRDVTTLKNAAVKISHPDRKSKFSFLAANIASFLCYKSWL